MLRRKGGSAISASGAAGIVMDFIDQLRVLQAAQGNPAELARVTVDLAYFSLPEAERALLKEALEVAAIPHWCDEAVLAHLLKISNDEGAARLARLRRLSIVEPFPARGETAVNVHESARRALRAWWADEQPERFRALSARAYAHFSADSGQHARIEAAFHCAVSDPETGSTVLERLHREWSNEGRFEECRALAVALDELRVFPALAPLTRAVASEGLGWIRRQSQAWDITIGLAKSALEAYRKLRDEWRISSALDLLSDALSASGHPEDARIAAVEALGIDRRRASESPYNPTLQRNLSIGLAKVAGLDEAQGHPDDAWAAYAEALEIRRRLVALDPANTQWQRDVTVSLDNLARLDEAQDRRDDARRAYAEALEVRRRLAALDRANTLWQRDVSISLNNIARLDEAQARPDDARRAYAEALEIRRRLVALDPANTQWQRDVSVSLDNLARLDEAQ